MFSEDKVTEFFCLADEFCKFFDAQQEKSMLETPQDGKRRRRKPNRMSDAEIIVILIHFHSGGFRCFKLHLVINDKGEILNFVFTTGGVDDREPLKEGVLLKNVKGKLFGDKGYIGKALF